MRYLSALTLLLALAASAAAQTPTLPDPVKTPGLARPLTRDAVCSTKWGADARHVTETMKRAVAKAYGMERSTIVAYGKGPCCEFDHLVSRELGGADAVANLWPQPWAEAKQKDRLENALHGLVCAGTLSLEDAQRAIRDWPAAFQQYVASR